MRGTNRRGRATVKHTYDQKCFDIAKAFLSEVAGADEDDADMLASEIQACIEDFIKYNVEARRLTD